MALGFLLIKVLFGLKQKCPLISKNVHKKNKSLKIRISLLAKLLPDKKLIKSIKYFKSKSFN